MISEQTRIQVFNLGMKFLKAAVHLTIQRITRRKKPQARKLTQLKTEQSISIAKEMKVQEQEDYNRRRSRK